MCLDPLENIICPGLDSTLGLGQPPPVVVHLACVWQREAWRGWPWHPALSFQSEGGHKPRWLGAAGTAIHRGVGLPRESQSVVASGRAGSALRSPSPGVSGFAQARRGQDLQRAILPRPAPPRRVAGVAWGHAGAAGGREWQRAGRRSPTGPGRPGSGWRSPRAPRSRAAGRASCQARAPP